MSKTFKLAENMKPRAHICPTFMNLVHKMQDVRPAMCAFLPFHRFMTGHGFNLKLVKRKSDCQLSRGWLV